MEIFEKVRQITATTLGIEAEGVTMETSIVEDLGADSLSVVELIMELEDGFGVSIPENEAKDVKTIADIVAILSAK